MIPGSPEANQRGCTCPKFGNNYGQEPPFPTNPEPAKQWYVREDCEIHWDAQTKRRDKRRIITAHEWDLPSAWEAFWKQRLKPLPTLNFTIPDQPAPVTHERSVRITRFGWVASCTCFWSSEFQPTGNLSNVYAAYRQHLQEYE